MNPEPLPYVKEIIGWAALKKEVGTSETIIRRLMAYYDFPQPQYRCIAGAQRVVWLADDVAKWLDSNDLPTCHKGPWPK